MVPQTDIPLVLLVTMVTGALSIPAFQQADDPGDCLDSSGNICSSRGYCIYGACDCPAPFSGPRCERIRPAYCALTRSCVQCSMSSSGQCEEACLGSSDLIQSMYFVDELDPDQRSCQYRDEDDCVFSYSYQTVPGHNSPSDKLLVHVKSGKECPEPAFPF